MNLELESALKHDLSEVAELLNRGFADYPIRIALSPATLLRLVARDSIDIGSSRVVLQDGEAVGIALIARRGWSSRLAGMALVPQARGKGIGRWLVTRLLAEARQRGERRMVLEVLEQNTVAVHLYQGCGFHVLRRLLSYTSTEFGSGEEAEIEEVDIREAARTVTAYGLPDLPWQVSGESLALLGPPHRAYRWSGAYVVISNPEAPRVKIHTVVVAPEQRRKGQATRLLRALMTRHPHKAWKVPALCPEEIGGVFETAGFERGTLTQLQMLTEWESDKPPQTEKSPYHRPKSSHRRGDRLA